MEHVVRLFEHLRWADESVLEGLAATSSTVESLPTECLETLAHVLAAEVVWLDRIEGASQSIPVWPDIELEGCRRLAETSHRRYGAFLQALEPTDLERPVTYRNSAGREFTSTLEEILVHVALHGTYHRGQIAARLRAAGLDACPTDYIAFARGAPAATRADSDPRQQEERT